MDILLAFIFGGTAGAVLHLLMPGRTSRGTALAPVLGAAVGGLKGFLICAVMVTLLTYFINDADFIKKSRMIQPIKETIVVFKQFLPEQYRK